jgi:WD40 repeat protein
MFLFEDEVIKEGEEFMAVKPWIGAVKEPDSHPEANPSPPDVSYNLEYAYGYRCQDSRNNVYYNPAGNICYMTACLGVILDKESNTQVFFGGGEVENTSKQVASDANHHNNDIMCMDVNSSGGRNMAVTGQVGKSPSIFIWDTATGEKIKRFKLQKDARAVAAVCISPNGDYIATADKHNDHNVSIFKSSDPSVFVFQDKGGPDEIFDMAFSKKEGDISCWSAGVKHIAYWNLEAMKKKKGLFGKTEMTSFACCASDD